DVDGCPIVQVARLRALEPHVLAGLRLLLRHDDGSVSVPGRVARRPVGVCLKSRPAGCLRRDGGCSSLRGPEVSGLPALLEDLDDRAGADGAAAFTDGEAEAGLHGDGLVAQVDL